MTLYVTDNPEIHKKLLGNSFLLYQIYDWRVIPQESDIEEDLFDIKKRFKLGKFRNELKLNSKVIAIVAPSNYKLIYDLLHLKEQYVKEVIFYSWDSWLKRKRLKIDKKEITELFNKYIQRGYFTKLIYKELSFFNLQRIEQFLIILGINASNKVLKCGSNNFPPIEYIESPLLDITGTIRILLSQGYTLRKAIDKLIYHSRKNDITDPFIGKFYFLNNDNSLFKKINDQLSSNIYKGINTNNEKTEICSFSIIVELLKDFIPLTDIFKTIRFLEKNDQIKTLNEKGLLETDYQFSVEDIKYYFNYISSKKWNEAYSTKSFSFGSLFPLIEIEELVYFCPLCGSSEIKSSPKHFFCSDINCSLYVNRIINPGGIKKQVTENEFIRLIHHGSALIKNKLGGYSRFFLEKNGQKIRILPQIEKNKIEED